MSVSRPFYCNLSGQKKKWTELSPSTPQSRGLNVWSEPARMLLISKHLRRSLLGGCNVGCFCVLVKWITPSRRRGTISIYGSEKRLADTTRGYGDLSGSPRLCKSASASPNQRFCLGAVLAFFISKPHFCWWLISPALLQGAALTFRRQTTGLAHCAHLLMKWISLYKWQKVCKLFINHFWIPALYDFGAMKTVVSKILPME